MYQPSLFGSDLGRVGQNEVQEIIDNINPYLWAAVVNPFDELMQRRSEDEAFRVLTEGEAAQWLRPQITRRAKLIFENKETMQFHEVRQQKYWTFEDRLAICFKKITLRRRYNQKLWMRS